MITIADSIQDRYSEQGLGNSEEEEDGSGYVFIVSISSSPQVQLPYIADRKLSLK